MLESIKARSIRDHLEKHILIHDSQHGFPKGRSCLTNLWPSTLVIPKLWAVNHLRVHFEECRVSVVKREKENHGLHD